MNVANRTPRFIWIIVIILSVIGIAMVIRRTLNLAGILPSFSPSGGPPFDLGFSRHPLLTFIHMIPGVIFLVLGPIQFNKNIRARYINFHRWSGRIFIGAGYIIGISAFIMSFKMAIGGLNETAATVLFDIFFLVALTKALLYILKKNTVLHREWMLRAFAIGLAIATVRPIMAFFFAFSGLPPQVFFGTAFWIGFTLHMIAAEVWINYTRG
jgi:predicted membrane protein DUF2306